MIKEVKSLEDLRDSRIVFDKQLPRFGYMLLIIVAIFLAGVCIWSIHTPKVYMITAKGTVSSEGANQVMAGCTGEITACNMREGQLVEKGEILFRIQDTEYEVKATASGILHLYQDYKEGMMVQTAEQIAVITPENADTIIETYVSTADMARIQKGDEAQIAVDGLAEAVYGNIDGYVTHIDSNLTMLKTEGEMSGAFHVHVVPKVEYLIGNSGDKVDLVNGMTVEVRIAYDKVSYFEYVLDKLGYNGKG